MRSVGKPPWHHFLFVFGMESLHVIGLALLFFVAIPGMDTQLAVMACSGVATIPAFLKIFSSDYKFEKSWHKIVTISFNVLALAIQLMGLVIWPIASEMAFKDDDRNIKNSWSLPIGMLLTSCGFWESFASEDAKMFRTVNLYLDSVKKDMLEKHSRYFTYIFVSFWKIVLFFALFLVFATSFNPDLNIDMLFNSFTTSFSSSEYTVNGTNPTTGDTTVPLSLPDETTGSLPGKVIAVQVICAWVAYIFSKFACKTYIQRVAFAIPMTLVMPVTVGGIAAMCSERNVDPCYYRNTIPPYTFFECLCLLLDPSFMRSVLFL